jgi:hypothetical protein
MAARDDFHARFGAAFGTAQPEPDTTFENVFGGGNEGFSTQTANDRFERTSPADGLSDIEALPAAGGSKIDRLNSRLAREGAGRGARARGRTLDAAQAAGDAFERAFREAGVDAGNSPQIDPTTADVASRQPTDADLGIPNPDGDTLKQRIAKSVAQNWAGFEQQAAGIARFGSEHLTDAALAPVLGPGGAVQDTLRPLSQAATQPVVQASEKVYRDAQADIDANQYNFHGKGDYYAQNIIDSLVQMVPTLTAAYLSGGASAEAEAAGAAEQGGGNVIKRFLAKYGNSLKENQPSLTVLGAQQGGQQYGQSRAAGRTGQQSDMDAIVFGLAEAVPEAMELDILMKPGGRFLPRLLKSAGMEGVSEVVTQAVETGYQAGVLHEKMTWGQAVQSMVDAGIIGFGMGAGMGAGAHGIHMARGGDQGAAIREMRDAQFDRPASEIASDLLSPNPGVRPVPRGVVEEAEASAPPPTAEDHASPLPTDLIQRGKQRMAGAAASGTANRILQDNGAPPVGTAVEIYVGGSMKKGIVSDAFIADDPQLGQSPGIKVKLEDGSIFEEHFADLRDANVAIVAAAGNQVDSKPPKPEHIGRTKEDAAARPTPNFDRMVAVTLGTESGNRDTDANGNILTSPAGAQGRMQVMPGTNRDPGFGVRPAADDSPEERARVGRDYLAAMMRRYGNDPAKAWAAYNAGPGAVDHALGAGGDWLAQLPGETQAYVRTNLRKMGSDTGALASTISQEPIEPDTGWIDDILRESSPEADAAVQAIAQGRDPVTGEDRWADWRASDTNRPEIDGEQYAMAMVAGKDPNLPWMPAYQQGAKDGASDMRDPANEGDNHYLGAFWRARNRYPHGGAEPDLSAVQVERPTLSRRP